MSREACLENHPLEFPAEEAGKDALSQRFSSFDLLLLGKELNGEGRKPDLEPREGILPQQAKRAGVPTWLMRIASDEDASDKDAKDRFALFRPDEGTECPLWHELPEWMRTHCAGKHLLLDLTTLSGSSLFQLHRSARIAGNVRLSYAYTTPKRYPQVDKPDAIPPVITRAIKQPYGYRSFAQEHTRGGRRRHILLLGFDRHRPNKFIEHYQWPLADVHALLGDPAYVQGGVEQAKRSLGSVYNELESLGHVKVINPKLLWGRDGEMGVVDALSELCSDVGSVDIVPLGPKPTLLGCIVYWHGLDESRQQQTRLLYDFPVTRKVRTTGVETTWVYPDVVVPRSKS